MIIKSKGLILRHAKLRDAVKYLKIHDSLAKRNFRSIPASLKESRKELRDAIKQYSLSITKRKQEFFIIGCNDEFAGWISLHDIFYKHKAVTSSLVASGFRGRGLGTKAHKMLLDYAFKKYKLKRISAMVRIFNKASAKMLENSGYKLEGVMKKNYCRAGKYYDELVYAKVK